MKKQFVKPQGLAKLKVIIQDTTETSSKYFNIAELPPFLSSGLNSFKFSSDNNNLVKGSSIYFEILDVFGNPIYYEIPPILDEANKKLVSIYIYDDTPPGKALITVIGTAKRDINGNDISSIPNNIRWAKLIDVKPNEKNNSPIIFKKAPIVTVNETFKNIASGSYINGSTIFLSNNDMKYTLIGNTPIVETITKTNKFNKEMIGTPITFKLTASMYSEPKLTVNNKVFIFNTTIADVLTEHKIKLTDPIIIDTEKTIVEEPPIWKSSEYTIDPWIGGGGNEFIIQQIQTLE